LQRSRLHSNPDAAPRAIPAPTRAGGTFDPVDEIDQETEL
jgi:hypothetical protein